MVFEWVFWWEDDFLGGKMVTLLWWWVGGVQGLAKSLHGEEKSLLSVKSLLIFLNKIAVGVGLILP